MANQKVFIPGEYVMQHALELALDPKAKRDEATEDAAYSLIDLIQELVKGCAAPNDVKGAEYRVKALRYWANVDELWDAQTKDYRQEKRAEIKAMTPEYHEQLERAIYVKLLEKGRSDKDAEAAIKAWKEGNDNSISQELLEKAVGQMKKEK